MTEDINLREIPPSEAPMDLLLLADPSEEKVRGYLSRSRCFVAVINDDVAGVCAVQEIGRGVYELMNIAVSPSHQQKGIGTSLLQYVISFFRGIRAKRLEVGTGTFGYQLTFYQRQGFRVDSIEKDFFLNNYPEPLFELGIQHKDMLRLALVH
jgi:ribosomal protein S18 acetylase RimI-like enzyme